MPVLAISVADEDGRTMLHWAASGGRNAVVDYLLGVGAEPNGEQLPNKPMMG